MRITFEYTVIVIIWKKKDVMATLYMNSRYYIAEI